MSKLSIFKKISKFKRVMYAVAVISMVLMFAAFGIYRLNGVRFYVTVGITTMPVC